MLGIKTQKHFHYGEEQLSVAKALQITTGQTQGLITTHTKKKIQASWQHVQDIVAQDRTVYGINTGFGPLCQTRISASETAQLQLNLLKSHSVGVGDSVPYDIAKLMLILKAQSLAQAYSGIATTTFERILWHIDNDVIPVVPSQGSVGASGDLAPLAHLFLPLVGLGHVWHDGEVQTPTKILQQFHLQPLTLGPKEGLALINGTQFIAAYAVKVAARFQNCLNAADIIGALSIDALQGSARPFDEKLHLLRPYAGAKHVAQRMRGLLYGSEILNAHKNCSLVQDPYSLRCLAQVHGASRDAWHHLKNQLHCELNSVTDNPIIFSAEDTISGGHFHGQPLALPLDYAAIAASEIGSISERRTYLLLEGKRDGLPPLLVKNAGLNSGLMIPQYTAAALVSENKTLCFPASVDSIPTSLGQEDHVSMGPIGARKAYQILGNLENILAIELLCAAQALDFRRPFQSSPILEAVHKLIRQNVPTIDADRIFAEDIHAARTLIASETLVQTAHVTANALKIDLNGELNDRFELH